MELIGQALVDMRDTVDPRLTLELALIRATSVTNAEVSVPKEKTASIDVPVSEEQTVATAGASEARAALGAMKARASTRPVSARAASKPLPSSPSQPVQTDSEREFNRAELVKAWGDEILDQLPQRAKARFRTGRFGDVEGTTAALLLPNQIHLDRCAEIRGEVEKVLSDYFGKRITLRLGIDDPVSVVVEHDDETVDVSSLPEARTHEFSVEDRLKEMFPGAEEVS